MVGRLLYLGHLKAAFNVLGAGSFDKWLAERFAVGVGDQALAPGVRITIRRTWASSYYGMGAGPGEMSLTFSI